MATPSYKRILVGIEFPEDRSQVGLGKAVEVAKRTSARLILMHAAFEPTIVAPFSLATPVDRKKIVLGERRRALDKLAQGVRRKGLRVTTRVEWDYPSPDAIVRAALREKADLVVAESHRRSRGARLFLTNTDWQLIRACPIPLLFVKSLRRYGAARLLAAVDPLHAYAKPAGLDAKILDAGRQLAAAFRGKLSVMHAYLPLSVQMPDSVGMPYVVPVAPDVEQEYEKRVRRMLSRLAAARDVKEGDQHLVIGDAASAISDLSRKLRANIVVMGAISRSGLGRLFIGSTAERVIDRLNCDVLVIKPRGFHTPVLRRVSAKQLYLAPL